MIMNIFLCATLAAQRYANNQCVTKLAWDEYEGKGRCTDTKEWNMRCWHCERFQCGPCQEINGRSCAAPAFRLTPASTKSFRLKYAILKHPPSCPCACNHSSHAGLHQSVGSVTGLKTGRQAAVRCTLDNRRLRAAAVAASQLMTIALHIWRSINHKHVAGKGRALRGSASLHSRFARTLRAPTIPSAAQRLSAAIWIDRKASRIGGKRVAKRL
jgi:hypothetical protein